MNGDIQVQIKVLDHGYMKFIESWGSDESIIEAARMSTNKGFLGWGLLYKCLGCNSVESKDGLSHPGPEAGGCSNCGCGSESITQVSGDEKLLRYLYENKHSTPFEMAGMVIEVQAPIFIFRQWHRHRTQSYNEMSARYTPLPDLNYRPDVDRCIVVHGKNKQARGATARTPTHEEVLDWLENYLDPSYEMAQKAYERGLEIGIPKDVARLPVPVARYSRMRAQANLRNWLAFLTLRMDSHAQKEIQAFANVLGGYVERVFPRTYELFMEGMK